MKPAPRQNHLAAIHMAQKALGLSAEDASALKLHVTGQASSATMTALQRKQYLAHLAGLQERAALARGEKPAYTPKRDPRHRSLDDADDERWQKARALWHALAGAGVVRVDTDAALTAYVKGKIKVDAWRFLNSYQVNQVIEMLKQWCVRCGVEVQP
ncbi:regulatory protein GemA [Rhodoferax sp. U2-2l]|uniref:regulatory protein GemA n=1 Tax=Rhodoferax sp. U2-2l TaxID=2884000 RepID=UPI001D0A980E|nr:regulatory protein GemA [Rhodoferax sp. U2-2l]MCB8748328.1 regulatory protein GemA [Rhodoferax sp. U2-2l]